jgi:hypothetical protein
MDYDNFTVTLCLIIIDLFLVFLLIHYSVIYVRLKKYSKKEVSSYKKETLKIYLASAIKALTANVNTVAQPYFLNKKIDQILIYVPSYIEVLKLDKYILSYEQSRNDLNNILIEWYGQNYMSSSKLNFLVKVKTTEYGAEEYMHYILGDIEKSIAVYVHNRKYIDNLIGKDIKLHS